MLFDTDNLTIVRDPIADLTDAINGRLPGCTIIAQGVVEAGFNFQYNIQHLIKDEYPFEFREEFKAIIDKPTDEIEWVEDEHGNEVRKDMLEYWELQAQWPSSYGVCDSWEQIIQKWPVLLSSERKFLINVTEIYEPNKGETGGWRWHKWGEYIGTHEIQYEYLADEDIDTVFVFHIYEMK